MLYMNLTWIFLCMNWEIKVLIYCIIIPYAYIILLWTIKQNILIFISLIYSINFDYIKILILCHNRTESSKLILILFENKCVWIAKSLGI